MQELTPIRMLAGTAKARELRALQTLRDFGCGCIVAKRLECGASRRSGSHPSFKMLEFRSNIGIYSCTNPKLHYLVSSQGACSWIGGNARAL